MEWDTSSEADSYSASQGIPRILWNSKVQYHVWWAISWASWFQSLLSCPFSL